ncbi:MAG: endo-1,4-beta-xylanase, partial [Acidobacteriota bacterium]
MQAMDVAAMMRRMEDVGAPSEDAHDFDRLFREDGPGVWRTIYAFTQHSGFPDLVDRECTLIVSAMEMFWGLNSKSTGSFDYTDADSIVDWAQQHKKKVRGHNLIWHEQTPKWFKSIDSRAEAEKRFTEHVQQMCSRFAGRMQSWDVVNEAIFPNDEKPGSLRESIFYKLMGPEYLDIAFRTARAADPKALLVYNEYNLECDIDFHEKRRRAIIELI